MTTSGTIGSTTISTSKVIEHALRRAGVKPSTQTPETVEIASECLYLLLSHYANKGINLWCIEKKFISYVAGQKNYALPTGTNDVLNVLQANPTVVGDAVLSGNVASFTENKIVRVGVSFSTLPTVDATIQVSSDGVSFSDCVVVKTAELAETETLYWFELDPSVPCSYVSVSGGTVSDIVCATSVSEIPVQPLSRDTYSSYPDKEKLSSVVTGFMFNKTLEPSVTLWPVPTDTNRHLTLWVHRHVQDVGRLTQTLAIPQRWFEATVIQLAIRLVLEVPGADSARIEVLQKLASEFTLEAANEETDSSPIYIQPNISAYTR